MIKFLIQRPIAVLMAFTACFIIGLVTYSTLPISLLPNIAIPEITVQVASANTSARELENTIVKPLRGQLIQVSTLKDIHSESRDGAGIIRLSFEYGTNTDLAFIEVNEKIDAAMNYLPKEAERPKVIKASATDIPVFYLNLTLKNDSAYGATEQQSFLELCEFAESVIKRRIEQLEEVAMVDVTGILERQVQIVPDKDKLAMMGLSIGDIESALSSNNVEPGSMTVRDGYYEYNIKFSTLLRTAEDVENICTGQTTGKIFEMVNHIAEGRKKQALELYYDLLALKEPPMRILFLIARQCNMLLQVKELKSKGYDNRTIASKIGVPPFVAGKYAGQAAKFKTAALRDAVEKCVEAEEAVKTGRMNDKMSVEILILSVL